MTTRLVRDNVTWRLHMESWSLMLDESGPFEGTLVVGGGAKSANLLVGGVLCPGEPDDLRNVWRDRLGEACRSLDVGYPPHGNELSEAQLESLVRTAATLVAERNGRWIFIAGLRSANAPDIALYLRIFSDVVEVAARCISLEGGRKLHIRPAQRSVPLTTQGILAAEKLGMSTHKGDKGSHLRALAASECRQAFDLLAHESGGILPAWPSLASVSVEVAADPKSHPGLHLADLGAHYLYRALKSKEQVDRDLLLVEGQRSALLLPRRAVSDLRTIDRALRSMPPDLLAAARTVDALGTSVQHDATIHSVLRESSVAAAEWWWAEAVRLLSPCDERRADAIASVLSAHADLHLSLRTGDYNGTWKALEIAWAGDTTLARKCRAAVRDRELATKLWRATMACANHRGDTATARSSYDQCEKIFGEGMSLVLLAERLHIRNLRAVDLQNRLPAEPDEMRELQQLLVENARALEVAADDAGAVVEVALGHGQPRVSTPVDEASLWRAAGVPVPDLRIQDHERGRCYGTIARTHAFLGETEGAVRTALAARACFGDVPSELRFNAAVIARIELEHLRLGHPPHEDLLEIAMKLAGVDDIADPRTLAENLRQDPGLRFRLDLRLRALLWAPRGDGAPAWHKTLRRDDPGSLYVQLATSFRSHPTELIARHAAEWLRKTAPEEHDAIQRWFDLSLAVCHESAEGGTLARLARFTEQLRDDPAFEAAAPAGSLLNPTFEYR
ncbi:MAG TPA: hypothetical protein VF701_17420 [Thermoanaerobaculia bacterium]